MKTPSKRPVILLALLLNPFFYLLFFYSWGRVLAATGSLPLSRPLSPTSVSVSFVPSDNSPALPVLVNGEPEKVDEVRAKEILEEEAFEVLVELGMGSEEARYWTCDFSYEYVSINGDYRT